MLPFGLNKLAWPTGKEGVEVKIQELKKSEDARRERFRRKILSIAMAKYGLDQRRIAELIEVSEKTISEFFRAKSHSLELARKLASAFGINEADAYRSVGKLPPRPS